MEVPPLCQPNEADLSRCAVEGPTVSFLLAAETIDDARIEADVLHLRRAAKGGQPIPWLYTRQQVRDQVVVDRHTNRKAEIGAPWPQSPTNVPGGTPELAALKLPLPHPPGPVR